MILSYLSNIVLTEIEVRPHMQTNVGPKVDKEMKIYDSAAEVVFMAAAATAVNNLQSMSHTLGNFLGKGPGGGVVDAARGFRRDDTDSDDDDPSQTKRTRESRPRPDYLASAWGVRLAVMENLRSTNRLDPGCREAKDFRSDFRVPYEFFLTFVEMIRPVFPASTHDITGRDCVPLELKVRVIYSCINTHEPYHRRVGQKLSVSLVVVYHSSYILVHRSYYTYDTTAALDSYSEYNTPL